MSRTDKDKPFKFLGPDEKPVHHFAVGGTWRGAQWEINYAHRQDRRRVKMSLGQGREPQNFPHRHGVRYFYF